MRESLPSSTSAGATGRPRLRIDGAQAWITLQRPEQANRLQREDLDELLHHLAAIEAQPEVRVLVLQAQGPHFCSGFNLEGSMQDTPGHFARVADALERARPVTLAAVQGGVYGGAVDLALACDLRLGVRAAQAAVPAVRLGLQFYRSGLQRAVQRLPWATAQQLYLLGQRLSAPALEQAGFFCELADDPPALEAAVQRRSDELLTLAPLALMGIKRALTDLVAGRADDPLVAAAIDASAARTERSADLAEGVQAWREGRPPRFTSS